MRRIWQIVDFKLYNLSAIISVIANCWGRFCCRMKKLESQDISGKYVDFRLPVDMWSFLAKIKTIDCGKQSGLLTEINCLGISQIVFSYSPRISRQTKYPKLLSFP